MKPVASYQKLRGGYYTPSNIAAFLSAWAIRSRTDTVLEPSCGDGAFVKTSAERLLQLGASTKEIARQLDGYEIDVFESARAADRLKEYGIRKQDIRVRCNDFFSAQPKGWDESPFDAVVGNPPFVRYQNFPPSQRDRALAMMRRAGLNPNRLTNIWVPFVVGAALALKPTGRLAMVIPAELLQVNYAAELRAFLSEYFGQITVLTFRRLAFEGIQQEVILLLAARESLGKPGIEVIEMNDTSELAGYDHLSFGAAGFKSVDHGCEKWTKYYLSQKEIDLIRDLRKDPRLTPLGEVASVDIGIVTGMNEVFVMKSSQITRGFAKFTCPLVGRSAHLKGIVFREADWQENAAANLPAHLLNIAAIARSRLPADLDRYLSRAEESKLNAGYKCRIRKLWYVVPSVYVSHGFLLRQIHSHPKLICNDAGAVCTDTIHRVKFKMGVDRHRVAAAFLNSLTFAFSEVLGRSYGGGVLELEPNEADKIPLPMLNSENLDPAETDNLARHSKLSEILERNDKMLLGDGLGMSAAQIKVLGNIWQKLQTRRTGRRTTKRLIPYEEAGLHTVHNRRSERDGKKLLYAT